MEVTPKDVVRRLYELLNARKFEDVPGLFSPHWAGHGIGEQGVQALVEEFRGFATGFPDLTCSPFDLIAEGDKVVALVVNRGTHTEEFMGHPLTGRAIEVREIDVHRVVDGRIAESWGVFDQWGMLMQLGMVAEPAEH